MDLLGLQPNIFALLETFRAFYQILKKERDWRDRHLQTRSNIDDNPDWIRIFLEVSQKADGRIELIARSGKDAGVLWTTK